MKQINRFEPFLKRRLGHDFDMCHRIMTHLVKRGFRVNVLGHQDAVSDVSDAITSGGGVFYRFFTHSPDSEEVNTLSPEATVLMLAPELQKAPKSDLDFFPTLMPAHFLAYSHLENPSPMVGIVHFEPTTLYRNSGHLWATACQNAQSRKLKVSIAAIDPLVGDYLRTYSSDLPIIEMPLPFGGLRKQNYSQSVRTVGFFGNQRFEKGMDIIPELIDRLLDNGYKIVLHDTSGVFNLRDAPTNIRLLNTFVGDLNAEMATCDLVICPMNKLNYLHRVSGIVLNAVATGIPFVLPAGTLPALRFQNIGSSSCYYDHSVDGIMEAFNKIASDYPQYATAARSGAEAWNEKHGVEKFVEQLIEHL